MRARSLPPPRVASFTDLIADCGRCCALSVMLVVQLSLLAFAVNLAAPAASYATVEIAYMGNEMARSYVEPCLAHTATATDSLYRFCRPRFRTTLLELPMLMVLESAHIGFLLGDVFYQSCMPEYVRDRREHVYAAMRELHCLWVDSLYLSAAKSFGFTHTPLQTPGVPLPTKSKR